MEFNNLNNSEYIKTYNSLPVIDYLDFDFVFRHSFCYSSRGLCKINSKLFLFESISVNFFTEKSSNRLRYLYKYVIIDGKKNTEFVYELFQENKNNKFHNWIKENNFGSFLGDLVGIVRVVE